MDPLERLEGIGQFKMVPGLSRMKRLMDELDSPQLRIPSVHIAGTNGKGSTAYMVDSILSMFGINRGLYTSPHLESVRERIVFNGEQVSPGDLSRALDRIFGITDGWGEGDRPTYFEMLTAAFFLLSYDNGMDMNIVEVGMGGRFDATNIIEPMASSIISISLDHQEHLGDEDSAIAREKAGIITPSTPVVLGPLHLNGDIGTLNSILDICTSNGCPVIIITPPGHTDLLKKSMMARSIPDGRIIVMDDRGKGPFIDVEPLCESGPYSDRLNILDEVLRGGFASPFVGQDQMFNTVCAASISLLALPVGFCHKELSGGKREMLSPLIECSTVPLTEEFSVNRIRKLLNVGLSRTEIRGRMEKVVHEGIPMIFDGAHNQSAARSLSKNISLSYPKKKICLLIAMMKDKDPVSFVENFKDIVSSVVVTELDSTRAMKASELAMMISETVIADIHVMDDLEKAVKLWTDLSRISGTGLATGSFHLYGPVMRILRRPTSPTP